MAYKNFHIAYNRTKYMVAAIVQTEGPAALRAVNEISKVEGFYLYYSLLREIHTQLNDVTKAIEYFETAKDPITNGKEITSKQNLGAK